MGTTSLIRSVLRGTHGGRHALAACVLLSSAAMAEAKEYRVFFLGGQSNMDGYGLVKDLPKELGEPQYGVMIYHGNPARDQTPEDGRGLWTELRPGHGAGFETDGKANQYSERFGPELAFAAEMRRRHPNVNIAIIKYSRGGTSIDSAAAGQFGCWDVEFNGGSGDGRGMNQFDHALATIRRSLAVRDIDGDGEEDTLTPAGIVWMQGESDAYHSEEIAKRYETNLRNMMNLLRAALRRDDLPVAIGRISDSGQDNKDGRIWTYGEIVRQAQADFVRKDACAALVTETDSYRYSDPYHYDSAGYVDLGTRFARAVLQLTETRAKSADARRD